MTQPTDRECNLPQIGKLDREKGEFWASNPFAIIGRHENLSAFERNKLFISVRGDKFLDASFSSNTDIDSDSRTSIATDLDGDGATDLLVGSAGGGSVRAFRNRMPQGNVVVMRLVGTDSNRAGIGARIVADFGDRQITRDLFPTSGFMGTGPAEVILGAADSETIATLTVRWPAGKTQVFTNIAVNQRIEITEGSPEFRAAAIARP